MANRTELTDEDYLARIKRMEGWLEDVRDSDRTASYKYLDLNVQATGSEWDDDNEFNEKADVPDWVPIGQTNYITINNEIKMAAVAMGTPLMYVRANENEETDGVKNAGEIVAKAWQASWENGNWQREFGAGLQKRGIIGAGFIRYYWDSRYGPCFEHVPYKRLLLDPNATNLLRMAMGGCIINKSVRDALALYDPTEEKEYFKEHYTGQNENANLDRKLVKIHIYYDKQTEVHAYQDQVIHKEENFYQEIPLIPNEGFIDPRDKLLPLGDNVFVQGLNQGLSDLHQMAFNTAKHGQQITLGDSNYFDAQTIQAIKDGKPQQVIFTKGKLNPQAMPIFRIAAEQLSQTWDKAVGIIQMALDGIMGTTPGQRGQQMQNVTATQSVMVENRSGARPTQERADFELWVTRAMRAYVMMMQRFGGPTSSDPGTEETRTIWKAFKAVYDVRMVDGCFVAGTLVDTPNGPVPIEELKIGDWVWSAAGLDKVLSTCRRTHENLYRISTSRGEFYCSFNHPFYVADRGYVLACNLAEGDILETREAMLSLQSPLCGHSAKGDRPEVLRESVRSDTAMEKSRICGADERCAGKSQAVSIGWLERVLRINRARTKASSRDERKQDAYPGSQGQGCRHSQTHRESSSEADRMEWYAEVSQKRYFRTPTSIIGSIRRAVATGIRHISDYASAWIPNLLCGRFGGSVSQNRNRSGRSESLAPRHQGERQEEGIATLRARVESVTILKRGHSVGDRCRNSEGTFDLWDIGVERDPSFFVSGVLVHNSASFEPPAADKQGAMQMYTTLVQSMPMWMQLAEAGVVKEIPNMRQPAIDLISAFKKQNMEQYWTPAPQPQRQQGPTPELIKALQTIYKDSPPDVQGQIEKDFGLTPSQLGPQDESGETQAESQAENARSAVEQEHELRMQEQEHHHEAAMETVKQDHEKQLKWWDIRGKLEQAKMKPKPTAGPKKPAGKK